MMASKSENNNDHTLVTGYKGVVLLDETGQAVTEYLVILIMAVSLFLTVFKPFVMTTLTRVSSTVSKNIEKRFLGVDLHYFPFQG